MNSVYQGFWKPMAVGFVGLAVVSTAKRPSQSELGSTTTDNNDGQ